MLISPYSQNVFISIFIFNYKEISPAVIPQATKIFVNGCWVGIHRNPDMLVSTLRRLRRRVSIPSLLLFHQGFMFLGPFTCKAGYIILVSRSLLVVYFLTYAIDILE